MLKPKKALLYRWYTAIGARYVCAASRLAGIEDACTLWLIHRFDLHGSVERHTLDERVLIDTAVSDIRNFRGGINYYFVDNPGTRDRSLPWFSQVSRAKL